MVRFFSLKKKDLREDDLEKDIQMFVNAIKSFKLRGDKF